MSRSVHYSPSINRFNVKVLYHEAKARGIPMTQLVNELLQNSLAGTSAWRMAEQEMRDGGTEEGNYGS